MMSLGKTLAGAVGMGFALALVALVALWGVAPGVYGHDEHDATADEDALTREYVEGAWEYYVDRGLSKMVERYGNPASWEGERYLVVADADTRVLVSSPLLYLNGRGIEALVAGGESGDEMGRATDTGHWFDSEGLNMLSGQRERARYFVALRDGLLFMSARFSGDMDTPLPEPPSAAYAGEVKADPRDLTRAFVEAGVERYERDGLGATLAYYNSPESIEGERDMTILRAGDQVVLATALRPRLVGTDIYTAPNTSYGRPISQATEDGRWFEFVSFNRATERREPLLVLAILHDGLIFVSGHYVLREDLAATTKNYVRRATEFYDRNGREATISHYDSRESVDGQFYLFLIGADDIYLAHPIFPHLKGTDIKDVVGSDGYELGKEIAKATEEGHWVDYLWPHPVSRLEQPKSAWVVRHDGLIFASGYYTPDPSVEQPAWKDADPSEYTVEYVERAIARYERDGLEAMTAYYNSVAAFEGEWYLFAMDAEDIYFVHPLFPHLIGTDIKNVVGSDGYELGKEIAKATEEGHWVEYLWPHPLTLREVPKLGYAKRHDGMIFASGYYPEVEDPEKATEAYIRKAIEFYQENGLDATVAFYNSDESVEGQWYLTLADGNGVILVDGLFPNNIGLEWELLEGFGGGAEWREMAIRSALQPGKDRRHYLLIERDGLVFASYYDSD